MCRVPSVEVLCTDAHIAELMRDCRFDDFGKAMQKGSTRGMQTFDTPLVNLDKTETITLEEALRHADSSANLEARINFG